MFLHENRRETDLPFQYLAAEGSAFADARSRMGLGLLSESETIVGIWVLFVY